MNNVSNHLIIIGVFFMIVIGIIIFCILLYSCIKYYTDSYVEYYNRQNESKYNDIIII